MKTITQITAGITAASFIAALNNNSSVDSIGITVGSSDITTKVFDYVCDGTADEVQINQAITAATALTNGGCVYLSPGIFNIAGSIIIKNNVRLISTPQTKINLSTEANAYMVRNDQYEAGNTDFSIIGGRWYGQRNNQTKVFTGTPAETFWGFGMCFKNCQRFNVENIYIEKTASWGIAHFLCTDMVFRNIEFLQQPAGNGDGITGTGAVNLTIDNVYGYAGDDMIAVAALSTIMGSLAGHEIIWGTGRDCKNISISNIHFGYDLSANNTYAGIGLYPSEGMTIEDVRINNISGKCAVLAFIHVVNYWPEKGGKGYITNLDVKNLNVTSTVAAQPACSFSAYSILEVDNFVAKNINYINAYNGAQTLFTLSSSIKKTDISEVSAYNQVGTNNHHLISIKGDEQIMVLNVGNVDNTGNLLNEIVNTGTSTGLRVNAPQCWIDEIAQVNAPVNGDRLIQKTTKFPIIYLTDHWQNVITNTAI